MFNMNYRKILLIVLTFLFLVSSAFSKELLDGKFSSIYPKAFNETTTGKVTWFVGGLALTPLTGGASMVWILGDITLTVALETYEQFKPGDYRKFQQIKIKVPQKGNKEVIKIIGNMDQLIEKFNQNNVDPDFFNITIKGYHNQAIRILKDIKPESKTAGYDYLLKAIILYNMREYNLSQESLDKCHYYFKNKSVLYYVDSLLYLTDGNMKKAKKKLIKSIRADKNASLSYALLVQLLIDEGRFLKAQKYALIGVKSDKEKSYSLPKIAGDNSYNNLKNYQDAIYFYRIALKNIGEDELEAECKLMIAKSYKKIKQYSKAEEWHDEAIAEAKGNKAFIDWINEKWNNTD